jgi:hypothetical protein
LRGVAHFERLVLPMAMTLVDLWVIEDGLWRFGAGGKVTERFIVFFEQRIDQRDEPSCNMTKNFSFPSVGLRPLVNDPKCEQILPSNIDLTHIW